MISKPQFVLLLLSFQSLVTGALSFLPGFAFFVVTPDFIPVKPLMPKRVIGLVGPRSIRGVCLHEAASAECVGVHRNCFLCHGFLSVDFRIRCNPKTGPFGMKLDPYFAANVCDVRRR